MKYPKIPLSFDEQADLLLKRGLVADRDMLVECLAAVNYYRLSAYWYTFRIPDDPDDKLMSGTTLNTIWRRYTFDRQLRLLIMDAIGRVEIAIRSQIVNRHVLVFGPFGYLDRASLPGISVPDHRKMLEKVRTEAQNRGKPGSGNRGHGKPGSNQSLTVNGFMPDESPRSAAPRPPRLQ